MLWGATLRGVLSIPYKSVDIVHARIIVLVKHLPDVLVVFVSLRRERLRIWVLVAAVCVVANLIVFDQWPDGVS